MRCEIVAVGTELLLGQVVDTNSAWLGEQLALAGVDSHFHTVVGDNVGRIAQALRTALARADAVIVCGGLGPTPDDVTREAIAEVMGVALVRHPGVEARIRSMFEARGREMPLSNLRQADVPRGARPIEQVRGTAPGLVCPMSSGAGDGRGGDATGGDATRGDGVGDDGDKVIYAVPGVPHEMTEMVERAVLPDLRARAGSSAVIASRVLRTWGLAEATVAERLAGRVEALERDPVGGITLAFLASGMEGIKVRLTVKSADAEAARAVLAAEEAEVRALLGDHVFGVDDETMEQVVGGLLVEAGLTLAAGESLTGGVVGARLTAVAGASRWFRGSVVAYSGEVKSAVLGVPPGAVVSAAAAAAMAEGAAKVLGADVGLGVTGVAGPTEQEGQPVGTVFFGLHLDGTTETEHRRLPGDRQRVREYAAITLLDLLRRRLLAPDRFHGPANVSL